MARWWHLDQLVMHMLMWIPRGTQADPRDSDGKKGLSVRSLHPAISFHCQIPLSKDVLSFVMSESCRNASRGYGRIAVVRVTCMIRLTSVICHGALGFTLTWTLVPYHFHKECHKQHVESRWWYNCRYSLAWCTTIADRYSSVEPPSIQPQTYVNIKISFYGWCWQERCIRRRWRKSYPSGSMFKGHWCDLVFFLKSRVYLWGCHEVGRGLQHGLRWLTGHVPEDSPNMCSHCLSVPTCSPGRSSGPVSFIFVSSRHSPCRELNTKHHHYGYQHVHM